MAIRNPPPDRKPLSRVLFGWVDSREVPWAGLSWIVLAAVLYSVLLLVVHDKGIWEWLSTFLATFLSVLAALFVYRHQVNRAEVEKMYTMYLALDADLEALLTRIDPSRGPGFPLTVVLPSGEVASAYVGPGEDRVTMFEEVAKAGFEKWRGLLNDFNAAGLVRNYSFASARFMALYDAAANADHAVGPNAERALLHAAAIVETHRKRLVEWCELNRQALRGWFERYPHFSPWDLKQDDHTPDWSALERPEEDDVGSTELE